MFDSNPQPHHHLYNSATGELTDILADTLCLSGAPVLPDGFELEQIEVIVRVRPRGRPAPPTQLSAAHSTLRTTFRIVALCCHRPESRAYVSHRAAHDRRQYKDVRQKGRATTPGVCESRA